MRHARVTGGGLAGLVGALSPGQRLAAGAGAALVGLTPFGAWETADVALDPVVVGEAFEAGPFEVTVVRAVVAEDLGYLQAEEGNRLLALVADVTNTTDAPAYPATLVSALGTPPDAGIVRPESILDEPGTPASDKPVLASILAVEDATLIDIANPGVTYRLAFVWEQGPDAPRDAVTVEVREVLWIEESATGLDDDYWLALDEVVRRGEIPITDADEATEEDEA